MAEGIRQQCGATTCSEPLKTRAWFYCPDHWHALMDQLVSISKHIARRAQGIYIGRSNYPERRFLEHFCEKGMTRMAVLHWAACRGEIEFVERLLIERLDHQLEKVENQTSESAGKFYGAWNSIYLMWRWKQSPGRRMGVEYQTMNLLDPGARIRPFRFDGKVHPVYFKTRLTRDEARAQLQPWSYN